MSILIGVGHKNGRGKDTVANRLVDKHGFIRVSWADSLKEACRVIFLFNDDQLYGDKKEKIDPRWGRTPRWILQRFGVEACRNNIDQDIWIKSAWLRIQAIWKDNPNKNIVIPDIRFPNEASFIKKNGGILWRVDRDIPENESSSHTSETSLDTYKGWDQVLINNRDITHLYALVDGCLESAIAPKPRRNARVVINTRNNQAN